MKLNLTVLKSSNKIRTKILLLNRFIERAFKKILKSNPVIRNSATFLSLLVIITFLYFQASLLFWPTLNRSLPPEVDDTYAYILKSAELFEDFFQQSPALTSLKEPLLIQTDNPEINWLRYKEHMRGYVMYHPLYSVALAAFHGLGLEWEQSYTAISILGYGLLSYALFTFLHTLVGRSASICAVAFLIAEVFPSSQGLHFIIPSTLALLLALISWSAALKAININFSFFVSFTALMVAMHPIGRVYSGLLVLLILAANYSKLNRQTIITVVSCTIIVAVGFILPLIVSAPDLKITSDPAPPGWSILLGIYTNIYVLKEQLLKLYANYGILSLFLACVGLLLCDKQNIKRILLISILLILICGAGTIHTLPRYPGDLALRSIVPLILVYAALVGKALLFLIQSSLTLAVSIFKNNSINSTKQWQLASSLAFAILLFSLPFLKQRLSSNVARLIEKRTDLIERYAYKFEADQLQALKALIKPNDEIAFFAEEPMHYFLVNKLWQHRMVYLPTALSTDVEESLVKNNPNLKFFVGFNPLERFPTGTKTNTETGLYDLTSGKRLAKEGGILLDESATLSIYLGEASSTQLNSIKFELPKTLNFKKLFFSNINNISIYLSGLCHDKTRKEALLTISESGWLSLPKFECNIEKFEIRSDKTLLLSGIKTDKQSTNWPWDRGISIQLRNHQNKVESNLFTFDTNLFSLSQSIKLSAVEDVGSLILLTKQPN